MGKGHIYCLLCFAFPALGSRPLQAIIIGIDWVEIATEASFAYIVRDTGRIEASAPAYPVEIHHRTYLDIVGGISRKFVWGLAPA